MKGVEIWEQLKRSQMKRSKNKSGLEWSGEGE
jgi:hypothetical protein